MKVPLSREERRKRFWQARRGWGYSKDMTRSEFIRMRDKAYKEKMMGEEARRKKAAGSTAGKGLKPKRGWGRKILILVIVIGAIVYGYFRYLR